MMTHNHGIVLWLPADRNHSDRLSVIPFCWPPPALEPTTGSVTSKRLPAIVLAAGLRDRLHAAVAPPRTRRWSRLAEAGSPQPLPLNCWPKCLTARRPATMGHWSAAPLARDNAGRVAGGCTGSRRSQLRMPWPVRVVAAGLPRGPGHRPPVSAVRRLRRLEAILEIASQWNQTREVEPLLVQMAEAATRLLGADRASIFLWDRPNHTLVGRPALGVPSGELRIPDDRGVVGEVIHTGQPRRVDAATEPEADRPPRRCATPLPDPHAAVRAAARPLRRAVRRVRVDQQATRARFTAGGRRRPWSSWPPTPPWPWKTPRTASSCSRPIARSPSRRPRRCG